MAHKSRGNVFLVRVCVCVCAWCLAAESQDSAKGLAHFGHHHTALHCTPPHPITPHPHAPLGPGLHASPRTDVDDDEPDGEHEHDDRCDDGDDGAGRQSAATPSGGQVLSFADILLRFRETSTEMNTSTGTRYSPRETTQVHSLFKGIEDPLKELKRHQFPCCAQTPMLHTPSAWHTFLAQNTCTSHELGT